MQTPSTSEQPTSLPLMRIHFCDFHRHFPQSLDYFRRLLGQRYRLTETAESPELVIFSNYGTEHLRYDCRRLFFGIENERPDFRVCDISLGFDHLDDPRHYRLPYFAAHNDLAPLIGKPIQGTDTLAGKTGFCSFVHSNPFGPVRNRLFTALSRYKPVTSGGRFRNNLGRLVDDKIAFMRAFKFAFAFENDSYPGYTTEKLSDALLANTLPIYWGNPRIGEDFNREAFLDRNDFDSDRALVERIIEIDRDDQLYLRYLNQPAFVDDQLPPAVADASVLDFITDRLASPLDMVVRQDAAWSRRSRRLTPQSVARRARKFVRHSVKGIRLATGY